MKYWEKLLIAQKKRGLSGLTIPFLIGSQEFVKNENSFQNINELIIDIVQHSSFEINLRYCLNLKTFILEKRNIKNKVYYPIYENKGQSNLSISIISKNDFGNTIEELIIALDEKYSRIIKNRTYSADTNTNEREAKWNKFSESSDLIFIKENI